MSKLQTAKQLAADNLGKLMDGNESLNRLEKVAAKAGVGRGTVERMKKAQAASNLDTLECIAKAFKIEPWQLIHPNLGVINVIQDEVEAQLLEDFRAASPTVKAAIISTSKISVSDKESAQRPVAGTFLQIQKK